MWNTVLDLAVVNTSPIACTVSTVGTTVLNACFIESNKVQVAYGSLLKPLFTTAAFMNAQHEMVAPELPVNSLLTVTAPLLETKKVKTTPNELVHVVSLANRGLTSTMEVEASLEGNLTDVSDQESEMEQTLAERIAMLQETFEEVDEEDEDEGVVDTIKQKPEASSLVTVLEQALQSSDNDMLEYVLRVTDQNVIDATMARLPAMRVIPFLTRVVDKFEKRPTRGSLLCRWIRAILMQHTAYLMTVPNLVTKLSALYQTLEARLRVFQQLYKLTGRLELVLGQISQRQAAIASTTVPSITTAPQNVYHEEEA